MAAKLADYDHRDQSSKISRDTPNPYQAPDYSEPTEIDELTGPFWYCVNVSAVVCGVATFLSLPDNTLPWWWWVLYAIVCFRTTVLTARWLTR